MHGLLEKLYRSQEENSLSSSTMWIVIPMVNIDGVVLGNNRTGLLGYDFNRSWGLEEITKKEKQWP